MRPVTVLGLVALPLAAACGPSDPHDVPRLEPEIVSLVGATHTTGSFVMTVFLDPANKPGRDAWLFDMLPAAASVTAWPNFPLHVEPGELARTRVEYQLTADATCPLQITARVYDSERNELVEVHSGSESSGPGCN